MAQRGIREYDAKRLFSNEVLHEQAKCVLVTSGTDLEKLAKQNPWLKSDRLVVKPDQLFGKRGKHGLVFAGKSWEEARQIIRERMGKAVTIGKVTGTLTHFLVEPFVQHKEELYVSIVTKRDCDLLSFSRHGGVDVEEKAGDMQQLEIPLIGPEPAEMISRMANDKPLADFLANTYGFFREGNFTYLEFNPFVLAGGRYQPLDVVAKVDDTAMFLYNGTRAFEFPAPFGQSMAKEELFIKGLDEKSGASLKLTVLNPKGLIWPIVAGGGASVIFADTICDLGHGSEIAIYGEYSGDPPKEETYLYAKTILDLMTREPDPEGRKKVILIGGGIANFTDIAATFSGIIQALEEYAPRLKKVGVKIYVRRGGPNFQKGLEMMKVTGEKLGIPLESYGPETHMTRIVGMAMGRDNGS